MPPPQAKSKLPQGKVPFRRGPQIAIVVTGGAYNNYWNYGGMAARQSVLIDDWR